MTKELTPITRELTSEEKAELMDMLKAHKDASAVWNFFVWSMKMIATITAGVTPLFILWKYIISDAIMRVPLK